MLHKTVVFQCVPTLQSSGNNTVFGNRTVQAITAGSQKHGHCLNRPTLILLLCLIIYSSLQPWSKAQEIVQRLGDTLESLLPVLNPCMSKDNLSSDFAAFLLQLLLIRKFLFCHYIIVSLTPN